MGQRKWHKIQKYIEKNDLPKLKSYVKKRKVELSSVRFEDDNTPLHLSAENGYEAIVRYLLHKGCSALLVNADGDIPLQVACHYALECNNPYVYPDLIAPLEKVSTSFLHENCQQATNLKRRIIHLQLLWEERRKKEDSEESGSNTDQSDSEEKWKKKLAEEADYEFYEDHPTPGFPTGSYDEIFESYDDWAERISGEFYRRHSTAYNSKKRRVENDEKSAVKTEASASNERPVKKLKPTPVAESKGVQQLRRMKNRLRYEEACKNVFHGKLEDKVLAYDSIPWPDGFSRHGPSITMKEIITELMFFDMVQATDEFRKYLRFQQIQWHPDKFFQRCGSRLKEDEKDKVLAKVNEISQTLNTFSDT